MLQRGRASGRVPGKRPRPKPHSHSIERVSAHTTRERPWPELSLERETNRLAVGVDVLQGLGGGQVASLVQRVLDGVYTQPRSPTRPVLASLPFGWSIVLMNSAKYVANVSSCSMIRP